LTIDIGVQQLQNTHKYTLLPVTCSEKEDLGVERKADFGAERKAGLRAERKEERRRITIWTPN